MAIQSDPFNEAPNVYTITVLGAMNPAIHHPAWYRFIDAISADELELATPMQTSVPGGFAIQLQSNQGFSSGQFSMFTVGGLRVTCLPEIWSVTATEESNLDRIVDVAGKVFGALPHTPVSGYTLNFGHHRQTRLENVGTHLARLLRALPLGILRSEGAQESATLRHIARLPLRDLIVDLQPSAKAKTMVFIGITAAHKVEALGAGKQLKLFELAPLLAEAAKTALSETQKWVAEITEALSSGK